VSYLDSLPTVDKTKKIGTNGYCMGGSLVLRSAAAVPERIGAVGSFHGGWLVTDQPDSPHLLAPKIHARVYVGIGSDDDRKQPEAKDKLRDAFAAAKVKAEIEVYPNSLHGWCIRDMPPNGNRAIYNQVDAEHSWQKLLALYKAALV
jgi:carboxymethylenebutenolidase